MAILVRFTDFQSAGEELGEEGERFTTQNAPSGTVQTGRFGADFIHPLPGA